MPLLAVGEEGFAVTESKRAAGHMGAHGDDKLQHENGEDGSGTPIGPCSGGECSAEETEVSGDSDGCNCGQGEVAGASRPVPVRVLPVGCGNAAGDFVSLTGRLGD